MREFACNWVLFALKITNCRANFSLETLEEVFLRLSESPKLKKLYSPDLNIYRHLSQKVKQSSRFKVQFYLLQEGGASEINLKQLSHDKEALHNFVDFGLKKGLVTGSQVFD